MSRLHVLEFIRYADGVWNLPGHFVDEMAAEFPDVTFTAGRDAAHFDEALPEAEVVLGWGVTAENFSRAKRLRWVQVTAAGVGPLLFPAMIESPVTITNARGLHAISMAEHTLGVILAFARKLHLARDAQLERRWTQDSLWIDPPPYVDLAGTTLGLVGLGTVGTAVATRARALGLKVIAVRRHPAADPAPVDAQWGVERLDDLVAACDWLVLAAPLTRETGGMMDARRLGLMKKGAILINLGRGRLVDETALIAALEAGRIAGAGLDVFEKEPLDTASPLWAMPNVIVTPHVSGLGPHYWERAMDIFRGNLAAYREGRPLVNVVDKRAGY